MKRILAGLTIAACAAAAAFGQVDVKTLTWLDYQVTGDSNGLWTSGGDFFIGRLYITVQGDMGKDPFGNSFSARVTLDLAKDQFNKTAAVTSVGTNGSGTNKTGILSAIPIKFAWFEYGFGFGQVSTNDAGKESKTAFVSLALSAGLLKSWFGSIAFWEFPIPVKDAEEVDSAVKVTPAADFGVMLSGKVLPTEALKDGVVKFYLQVLNGEGYDFLQDNTTPAGLANNLAWQASLFVQPMVPGFSLGVSCRYEDLNYGGMQTTAWAAVLSIKDLKIGDSGPLPFDCLFEYVRKISGAYGSSSFTNFEVLSGTLGYGLLGGTVYPYVRMDYVAPGAGANGNYAMLYACVNFMPIKDLSLKPMFDAKFDGAGAFKGFDIKAEGEYRLGFTVIQ